MTHGENPNTINRLVAGSISAETTVRTPEAVPPTHPRHHLPCRSVSRSTEM
jgi:hypothetical protein